MKSSTPLWLVRYTLVVAVMVTKLHCARFDNIYYGGMLNCTQQLQLLDIPNDKIDLIAECPQSCLDGHCRVRGSSPYTPSSSCCCAAIHHGSIDNNLGGKIHIRINHGSSPPLYGSTRHGIKSRSYSSSSYGTFTFIPMKPEEGDKELQATPPPVSTTTKINKQDFHPQQQESVLPDNFAPPTIAPHTMIPTAKHEGISRSLTAASRSQHTLSDNKADIEDAGLNVTNPSVLSISRLHFIVALIGVLAAGITLTLVSVFAWKTLRHERREEKPCCRSKVTSTSRSEDPDVCVCYQNLNSSQQGLLTDPETCDRPCPMKPSPDSDLGYLTVERELLRHDKMIKKDNVDNCETDCSGKCHPEQFEF